MYEYPWADNKIKIQLAIKKAVADCNETGKPVTEETVKQQYISLGGKLINQNIPDEKVELENNNEDKIMDKDEDKVEAPETQNNDGSVIPSDTVSDEIKTDTEFSDTKLEDGSSANEDTGDISE